MAHLSYQLLSNLISTTITTLFLLAGPKRHVLYREVDGLNLADAGFQQFNFFYHFEACFQADGEQLGIQRKRGDGKWKHSVKAKISCGTF